jgi:hypothetical protein
VFNAAHWRTGAIIPRCVGDDHDVRLFNVFGAKVIAMIGRPSATILSRSITITLHRKTAGERVELLREDLVRAELGPLRQQWRRWTVDHLEALRVHDPAMPADLPVNRASDNWRPLLSIADLAGGSWPARARAAAIELSGVRVSEDEPVNVALLVDVQAAFRERGQPEYLSSEEIIVALKARAERPWADWNQGRGISAAQLAHRLRGFGAGPWGLRTRKTRLDASKTAQRWHRADFADAWSRYMTADPEHPEQTNKFGSPRAIFRPEHPPAVPGQEMAVQPMLTGLVPGVPAAQGENGHDVRTALLGYAAAGRCQCRFPETDSANDQTPKTDTPRPVSVCEEETNKTGPDIQARTLTPDVAASEHTTGETEEVPHERTRF